MGTPLVETAPTPGARGPVDGVVHKMTDRDTATTSAWTCVPPRRELGRVMDFQTAVHFKTARSTAASVQRRPASRMARARMRGPAALVRWPMMVPTHADRLADRGPHKPAPRRTRFTARAHGQDRRARKHVNPATRAGLRQSPDCRCCPVCRVDSLIALARLRLLRRASAPSQNNALKRAHCRRAVRPHPGAHD